MKIKYADICIIRGNIYIWPLSKTEGPLRYDLPIQSASLQDTASIGDMVKNALANSRENIRTGDISLPGVTPLLKMTKSRSWNALARESKTFSLEQEGSKLKIVPQLFGGSSGPNKGLYPDEAHISFVLMDSPSFNNDLVEILGLI